MPGNLLRKGKKPLRWALISVILICIAVILEFAVSNYRSLFIDTKEYDTDADGIADYSMNRGESPDSITIEGAGALPIVLPGAPDRIYAVKIGLFAEKDEVFSKPIELTIKAKDAKRPGSNINLKKISLVPGHGKTEYVTVWLDHTAAQNSTLVLSFDNPSGATATITEITVNPSKLFSFNPIRMTAFALIFLIAFAISELGLNRESFDIARGKHIAAVGVTLVLCIMLTGTFCAIFIGGRGEVAYPLENGVNQYNPYVQQTDAFLKGQLHIDYKPSDELLALENPYDYSSRDGIFYLWDRALYDGKYYSYFGIAPIINVYLPHYLIHRSLPSENTVISFYAISATVFMCMFIVAFVVIYRKKVAVSLLCISMITLVPSSGLLLMARGVQHFYYIATVAGFAYLSAFMFFILLAVNTKHKIMRPVLFGISGLLYAFLFLARLNMALLTAFAVVPILYFCLIRNRQATEVIGESLNIKRSLPEKLIDLASLGTFVVIALVFSMWFNKARFGSPLEFGTTYQLTVSDISQNHLRIDALPYALYHYFIQPFGISGDFPYFRFLYSNLNNYGTYVYVDTGMGMLAIPLMLGLFGSIEIFISRRYSGFVKALCASLIVGFITVAWMNFCLGGVIFRYTCDMTLIAAVMSTLILFSVNEDISCGDNGGYLTASARAGTELLMIFSAFVVFCVSVQINGNLASYDARAYSVLLSLLG